VSYQTVQALLLWSHVHALIILFHLGSVRALKPPHHEAFESAHPIMGGWPRRHCSYRGWLSDWRCDTYEAVLSHCLQDHRTGIFCCLIAFTSPKPQGRR